MAIDLGQHRAQQEMMNLQHAVATETINTQRFGLALDAAKFIITLARDEENDVAFFTDDEIKSAYVTVANISRIFSPQINVPQSPPQ